MNGPEKQDFERRLQSIAQAVILAIMLGIGYAVLDLTKAAARQEVRNEQTARDIAALTVGFTTLQIQVTNGAIAAANAASASAAAAAVSTRKP